VLLREIETRLAEAAPRASAVVTEVNPVVGAALLGLDRCGAPESAKVALRTRLLSGPAA
jgi:hypothetical protein